MTAGSTPFILGFGAAAVCVAVSAAVGAPTRTFRQTSARDFEEGEATASMILPTGEVVPGMRTTPVGLEAAFVWCSTKSPDGRTAYFGSGDEGKIFALATEGREPRARLVATLDAAWVTALVARPDGTLVAGTTPGGRLYSVDPKSGRATILTTLPADHVWSLALDPRTGGLVAGTGSPGKIFTVSPTGEVRALWDSHDKHVVSLLMDDDRTVLAGTSEEAILFRVGLDGRAEALADFDAEEVRAIAKAPDGRAVYVAVNDFEHTGATATGPVAGPTTPKGTRITVAPSGSPASAGSLPRPGQRKARAALYRIERDGEIQQMFAIPDGYFTTIAFDDDARAYVGTGTDGRVYRVGLDRTAALAIDLPERQALTLVRAGKGFLVGTGDVGSVYRAEPAPPGQASYLSRVLDGEFRSRWGLLRWHGSPRLAIESRSGSTARPDATWSAFARLASARATSDGGAGLVSSPPARYVQYRVTFDGPDSRLGELSIAYLPQNQRARVTDIGTADSGASSSSSAAAGSLLGGGAAATGGPAGRAHSAIVKLRWKVDNPDGDELDYRLMFRQESEAVWRPLGGSEPLSKTEYDWNTEGLPDGSYVVRVTASDERVQPRERALDAMLTSAPILIDNRRPEVVGLTARYPFVSGRARDDQSPVSALEYAIDGGEWQPLLPNDGLCDDLVEAFTVKLPPALAAGPHSVTIRAWDGADNVGAATTTVRK